MTTAIEPIEYEAMQRALELARYGLYTTTPNPRVGAVVVQQGRIVGEGWHHRAGEAHAEIHALQDTQHRGMGTTNGATMVLTLEPCCHQGRTSPCTQALMDAHIARVVFAVQDPNPRVSGKGMAALREQGITVIDMGSMDDAIAEAAFNLNPGFMMYHQFNRPWVQLKMALSLDGRTAMANGHSQWITGAAARQDGQYWRARSCAIVTGIDTALSDDPRLSVRHPPTLNKKADPPTTYRQPLKVVLDSRASLPESAAILRTGSTLQMGLEATSSLKTPSSEYWQAPEREGRIDLAQVLQELTRRDCLEVLIEAGATLAGAFIEQGLVDQWIVYIAPRFLGQAAYPFVRFNHTFDLQYAWPMYLYDHQSFGEDLRLIYRRTTP